MNMALAKILKSDHAKLRCLIASTPVDGCFKWCGSVTNATKLAREVGAKVISTRTHKGFHVITRIA